MPLFTVEGRAVRHLPAERGTVYVAIRAQSDDPQSAQFAANRAFGTVVELAKGAAADGAATWWGANGVVHWSAKEWHKPKPHLDGTYVDRHFAGATLRVKFADFGRLHTFVTSAAAVPAVRVTSIEWALTENTRDAAVSTTRVAAVTDARARAEAYATAAGYTSVALVHLYEERLRPGLGHRGEESGVGARNDVASAGDTGDLSLHPDQITVTTVITADFEAE
ncbi:SIMPL domain-containing protein [Xylanimonas allomyrinae]|nr:SIMPL domain-containing protein [Xylanimonas allomyrinae]